MPTGVNQDHGKDLTPALIKAVEAPEEREHSALRRRLMWISVLRIVSIVVLAIGAVLFTAGTISSFLRSIRDMLIWVSILHLIPATVYVPAVAYAKTRASLIKIAKLQIMQDCIFSALLVAATGGTGSAFTFFFSITIVIASTLIGRSGTVLAVSVSTFEMMLLGAMEMSLLPIPEFLNALLSPTSVSSVLYSLIMNCVAFVSIGFLSSYLAESLRRADIQREHYRANLEDLRQLHEGILASVSTGIITCRDDNRIIHLNRAAEVLAGVSFYSAAGRSLFEVMPEVQRPMEEGKRVFEIQKKLDEINLSLLVTVTPMLTRSGERQGRILAIEDVTLLRQLEAKMKSEERLATIGKLAAVVAHEIRNPLATMSASAQMLAMSSQIKEEDRRILELVMREAERLNQWISELLDYARPRRGLKVKVDLSELVAQVVEILRGDPASASVQFNTYIEPGVSVLGDPQRLHRVVLNIGKNAIEAMKDGGLFEARCWSETDQTSRWAVVAIMDTGCGIAKEDRSRIFDAFYTTKPRGTGLGLAVVQQVVEEHGGTVTFESEPGVRTEFVVRLPM